MKLKRHARSIFFGVLLGITFAVLVEADFYSERFWNIVLIAFLGVLVPNLDRRFWTKLNKKNWWVNFFLIPFLIMLLIPKVYVTAFFVGYYGHVLNDLDKKNNLEFAKQRAIVGLLWIISISLIMLIFKLNFYEALRLFE